MTEEKEPSLREAVASELASQVEDLFKDTLNWGCTNIDLMAAGDTQKIKLDLEFKKDSAKIHVKTKLSIPQTYTDERYNYHTTNKEAVFDDSGQMP